MHSSVLIGFFVFGALCLLDVDAAWFKRAASSEQKGQGGHKNGGRHTPPPGQVNKRSASSEQKGQGGHKNGGRHTPPPGQVNKRSASSEEGGQGGPHGHNFTLPSNCTAEDKVKFDTARQNGVIPAPPAPGQAPPSGQAPPAPGQAPTFPDIGLSDVCKQAIAAELAEHHGPGRHGKGGHHGGNGMGHQGGQGNSVAKRSPAGNSASAEKHAGGPPQLPACQNAADQTKLQAFRAAHPWHGGVNGAQAQGQAPPTQGQAPPSPPDVSAECAAAINAAFPNKQG